MKLNKKKKGFTLIELMAVIAIVAILAAVLVPTVSGYITRSKKTAVITQARTVMNAVESYNITATAPIITEKTANNAAAAELETVTTLVSAEGKLTTSQLLTSDEATTVLEVPVYVIAEINKDSNAVNNITIDSSTKELNSYNNGKSGTESVSWKKQGTEDEK